jgi:putative membrane protein
MVDCHNNINKRSRERRKSMFWGFHGLVLLLPLVLFFKFFWIVLLVLLIAALVRGFGRRNRWMAFGGQTPFYTPGTPPVQPSALEILRQRFARGEIDATTYEQMRERLEASGRTDQQ